MWNDYGKVAIGTYLSVYIVTLSSIFFSLDYDLFSSTTFGVDPQAAIKKVVYLLTNSQDELIIFTT